MALLQDVDASFDSLAPAIRHQEITPSLTIV